MSNESEHNCVFECAQCGAINPPDECDDDDGSMRCPDCGSANLEEIDPQ